MASDTTPTFWNDEMEREPELTEREQALRNKFVDEYLVDYDAIAAAMRVGFMKAFAVEYAKRFMDEAYVRNRIKGVELEKVEGSRVDPKSDKLRVMATYRELAYGPNTPPAVRVQAARELAAYYGMNKGLEGTGQVMGGVMQVPTIADIDEWEAVATASQAKLVADARS